MARNIMDEGTYNGTLNAAYSGETDKGTAYISLQFNINFVLEEAAWEDIESDYPILRDVRFYLSDKAWDISESQLQKIGFDGNFDEPKFKDELTTGVELTCEHQVYDGRTQERWSITELQYQPKERLPLNEMEKRKLAARYKTNVGMAAKPTVESTLKPKEFNAEQINREELLHNIAELAKANAGRPTKDPGTRKLANTPAYLESCSLDDLQALKAALEKSYGLGAA